MAGTFFFFLTVLVSFPGFGGLALLMMIADASQMKVLGRLMVNFCTLVGGCRDRLLMGATYCTLDR